MQILVTTPFLSCGVHKLQTLILKYKSVKMLWSIICDCIGINRKKINIVQSILDYQLNYLFLFDMFMWL